MQIPAKAFVLDLDDTLIDNDKVKALINHNLEKLSETNKHTDLLQQTYSNVRADKGFVDFQEISKRLGKNLNLDPEKILTIFYDVDFKNCLFPSALELIQYLQTLGKVILFSQGELEFQSHKINRSGVEEAIGLDNVRIIQNKKEKVQELIQELHIQGFKSIAFIEDRADILDEAYTTDKSISCYWLRIGRHKDTLPKTSCVTFQSDSLKEIFDNIYQNNTVAKINTDSIKIKQGLTPNQINQLITFTNADAQVLQFTSDSQRFSNKKTFNSWLKNGKYMYSLVNINDNLLGIVWFSEKQPPVEFANSQKYRFTVAIRIYGESRGKGFSKQFLNFSIKHFQKTPEYLSLKQTGLWVVIDKGNVPSLKLHESLKFKQVTKPDNQDKIIFTYE